MALVDFFLALFCTAGSIAGAGTNTVAAPLAPSPAPDPAEFMPELEGKVAAGGAALLGGGAFGFAGGGMAPGTFGGGAIGVLFPEPGIAEP